MKKKAGGKNKAVKDKGRPDTLIIGDSTVSGSNLLGRQKARRVRPYRSGELV